MKNIKNQSIKRALVFGILIAGILAAHAQNNSAECCFYANHTVPEGAISGAFSVSPTKQVYFSQGNLQYQASTGTWRFAEHQYDYIGGKNRKISPRNNGWIDLFCWGSSGWNGGVKFYQPWHRAEKVSDIESKCATYTNDLTGYYEYADWGVFNAISNGGGQAGLWRTLTKDEWEYVLNKRHASTLNGIVDARFVYAKVAKVRGIILFPDNYSHPKCVKLPVFINNLTETQEPGSSQYWHFMNDTMGEGWEKNIYSVSEWELMERAGCVFLPAAGYRTGTKVWDVGSEGHYWSASYFDIRCNIPRPNAFKFRSSIFWPDYIESFIHGLSVRLVYAIQ